MRILVLAATLLAAFGGSALSDARLDAVHAAAAAVRQGRRQARRRTFPFEASLT